MFRSNSVLSDNKCTKPFQILPRVRKRTGFRFPDTINSYSTNNIKFTTFLLTFLQVLFGFAEFVRLKTKMGSTSGSRISCFQCKESSSSSDQFKNAWRLRNGDFAKLCFRCASIFSEGRFCETFHSQDDGWRDCESCGKLVHCGCIASFHTHMLLDFGGVICMDCTRINLIQVRNLSLPVEMQLVLSGKSIIEPEYLPHATPSELQEISRNLESLVIPLFEKQLTNTDADQELARLVLPTKCAEAYFPYLSDPRGCLIKIYDVEGKAWDFVYRYWINSGSKMHVIEGLKEFMIANRWEAGDTVTFYKLEPAGSVVIGLRKKPLDQQANEPSTS